MPIKNVAIFTADRAERGLLQPIYDELTKAGISAGFMMTTPGNPSTAMQETEKFCEKVQFDFAIVPCDRPEMVGVALWLFYHNKPFGQFHAGDIGSGTHDEVGRWVISRCASIHFCNTYVSASNVIASGEEKWRIHTVGSTAFDDIEPDEKWLETEGLTGRDPWDLLLVHPDTFSREQTQSDIEQALAMINKDTVIIGPNKDQNHDVIEEYLKKAQEDEDVIMYWDGVPRPAYLALLKHCNRFISNSSSALYELPFFGIEKWVNIGKRNADRKPLVRTERGGSKKIAEIIKNLELDDKLLRKRFTP